MLALTLAGRAQDTIPVTRNSLVDELRIAFAHSWEIGIIPDTVNLRQDSFFIPTRFILRARFLQKGAPGSATVYFASNLPQDSVLYHYLKNIMAMAVRENDKEEEGDESGALNSNEQLIAFSFCTNERICTGISDTLADSPRLLMKTPEIKIEAIKIEEKTPAPPPPPPPPPKNNKGKRKL